MIVVYITLLNFKYDCLHLCQEQALDSKTRIMLYKMVNNEVLDTINGCISTGKEAVVFHAKGGM